MMGGSRTQSHCSRAHAAKELASGPGTPEGHPARAAPGCLTERPQRSAAHAVRAARSRAWAEWATRWYELMGRSGEVWPS
jgi:hypothetical protein